MAAKVTINKPSAVDALVADVVGEVVVKSDNGLTIKLKKPNVLAPLRLVKILGETAENRVYMRMVLPLLFVTEIDGEPVAFPQTERALESLMLRLDEAGMAAVNIAAIEHWGEVDPDATKAEIKNS